MPAMTKTRSQQHSSHALAWVRGCKEAKLKDEDVRNWLDSLPGLILVNGLIATLIKLEQEATKIDKADKVAQRLVADLAARGFQSQALSAAAGDAYMLAQRTALAYVAWLKKWGQALLPRKSAEKKAHAQS